MASTPVRLSCHHVAHRLAPLHRPLHAAHNSRHPPHPRATDLLAVTCGDLSIAFFDTSMSETQPTAPPKLTNQVFAPKPQRSMAWDPHTRVLFTASSDPVILCWSVQQTRNNALRVSLSRKLQRHEDMVTRVLTIPSLHVMLSAGMDGKLHVWDVNALEWRSQRAGHQRGLTCVAHIGGGIALTGSFDCTVLAWDVTGHSARRIFRLGVGGSAHRAAILDILALPDKEQAISADVEVRPAPAPTLPSHRLPRHASCLPPPPPAFSHRCPDACGAGRLPLVGRAAPVQHHGQRALPSGL